VTQGLLLALVDGFGRADQIAPGAGFNFHKNQDIAMTADQVDLAIGDFVVAGQHPCNRDGARKRAATRSP